MTDTEGWISHFNRTHRDKTQTKGSNTVSNDGQAEPKQQPVTGTIERHLNRNPDQVIADMKQHVAKFDAEYDQGDTIVVDFDLITDLIDVATELRKAAPDA